MISITVPLVIYGNDITPSSSRPAPLCTFNPDDLHIQNISAVGATPELCVAAAESRAKAFILWKDRSDEIHLLVEQEISRSSLWARINVLDSIAIVEEVAAITTSGVLSGLVAIVKNPEAHAGSEISSRTHYMIAKLFVEAGFPPGVVNYIQHPVQKCNFAGSTAVGKQIAPRAAFYLKPVHLELAGKIFAIILEDAYLVLVSRAMSSALPQVTSVTNARSQSPIDALVSNAMAKGAKLTIAEAQGSISTTIIEEITPEMDFWSAESFGPLLGTRVFGREDDAVKMVNDSPCGLSGAVFSGNHLKILKMARKFNTGAVHVNSATAHDEAGLPHGGWKKSGWGRFGGQ
ncbi:ALDH-like protein [Tothia fuscella]|uniref:ALDH-like protein n=1 Tax=Tothia fuscella TaxID=1048955 RepID=A0A9P4NVQ7_9PEZI|nr:ALDH-like protein [Tothia fuscella]